MATNTVTMPGAGPRPEFMKLNARYLIAEGASLEALGNDVTCLFEAGLGVFEAQFEELDSAGWAGLYALRQALAVFKEYQRQVDLANPPWEASHG